MKLFKKFNKIGKATIIVAFLFGIVALASPGLCSQNSYEVTTENSPCEVVCSNSLTKVDAIRSYKNANKQIETNTNRLVSFGENGWITLEYDLFNIFYNDLNDDYSSTYLESYCTLSIDYNYIYDYLDQTAYFDFYYFDETLDFNEIYDITSQDIINNTISTILTISDASVTFQVYNSSRGLIWNPLTNESTNFIRGTYEYGGMIDYDTILQDINILRGIANSKDKGLFENADIQYGVLDVDNFNFVGPTPSTVITALNGGYTTTFNEWDDYTNYISENGGDYFLGNVVDFNGGKDISPYKFLLPIGNNDSNTFLFGQQLRVYFDNGYVWTVNGADVEYGQSAFDISEITKLSGSYIVTKIIFTGNNEDYIPYGLSTSTDYTAGYDNGYKNGYDIGIESGYNNGYLEGKNDVNEERYQAGYNKGYDDATERYSDGSLSLNGVLNAIVTAPSKIIKEGLDFELLGFNVGSLVMSLIVIGLVVWAIGFFKKG